MPEDITELVAPHTRTRLTALFCSMLVVYAIYLAGISVLLPVLQSSFHLTAEMVGRIYPGTFAGFVTGVLACGYLSDRHGRKPVLAVGTAVYAVGLALLGIAPVFVAVLPAALLIGFGAGAIETVGYALVADLYPTRKAFIFNLTQVAFGLGAASGPLLARAAAKAAADWRLFFLMVAAATILLFLWLLRLPCPRVCGGDSIDLHTLRALLRNPQMGMLCLAEALYVAGETSYFSWIPTYFKASLPDGAAWGAAVVTVFWVAMTVGRATVTVVVERTGARRLAVLLALAGVFCATVTAVPAWRHPLPPMICVALTGLCFSGIFSLVLAEATARFPAAAGTTVGGVIAAGGVGGAVWPWLVGIAVESIGWSRALCLSPAAILGVAILMALLPRRRISGSPSLT